MKTKEDFSNKYLKSNFLIQWLIRNFYNSVKDILFGVKFQKVLEVGCGPGFSTQYLTEILKSKEFESSEYKEDLVKKARNRNPDIQIRQESIYELKRKSNSFDLLIALEVLEHLENPDLALKELKRVTSKYCLLSVPNEPLWQVLNVCRLRYLKDFGNTPGHLQHWSKNQFIKFLSKYFQIKKIKTPLPWIIALIEKR